jgi:hypothetical protein
MSCKACGKIQQANKRDDKRAYIRIGNAIVLIGACDKHFNQLRQMIGLDVELTADVGRASNEGRHWPEA